MDEPQLNAFCDNEKTENVPHEKSNEVSDEKINKDKITENIIALAEERASLIHKNQALQQRLSLFIKGSSEKDYFQKLNFSDDADEWSFRKLLDQISEKVKESENLSNKNAKKIESLKKEVTEKKEYLAERKVTFKEETERAALHSVNSESGECFTTQEVKEILKKEKEVSKTLEEYQLQAIQSRHNLNLASKKKKNLAEGPLDFAEYEMMCIETQNNKEIIQPMSEEIKNLMRKASNIINVLSHLNQKLYLAQKEKNKAKNSVEILQNELSEMRDKLFEEKMKYSQMKRENKELQHKFILLQHPQLIEEYKNIVKDNEDTEKKLQSLKTTYENEIKFINK